MINQGAPLPVSQEPPWDLEVLVPGTVGVDITSQGTESLPLRLD